MVDRIETKSRRAFLYPGQGSQIVGMGKEVYLRSPLVRKLFDQASAIVGYSMDEVCFADPHNKLTGPNADTSIIQPAIFTVEVGIRRHLVEELEYPNGEFHMGHSVGKFAALEGSGSLDFERGIEIMRERGSIMQDAKIALGAAVGIIIGGPAKENVEEIIHELKDAASGVRVTIQNGTNQFLVGGPREQVEHVLAIVEAKRKYLYEDAPLSHHPALQFAQDQLNHFLDTFSARLLLQNIPLLNKPLHPVIDDIHKRLIETASLAEASLRTHLVDPLLWTASVQILKEEGVEVIVEIGPGKVLRGLLPPEFKDRKKFGTSNYQEIDELIAA